MDIVNKHGLLMLQMIQPKFPLAFHYASSKFTLSTYPTEVCTMLRPSHTQTTPFLTRASLHIKTHSPISTSEQNTLRTDIWNPRIRIHLSITTVQVSLYRLTKNVLLVLFLVLTYHFPLITVLQMYPRMELIV